MGLVQIIADKKLIGQIDNMRRQRDYLVAGPSDVREFPATVKAIRVVFDGYRKGLTYMFASPIAKARYNKLRESLKHKLELVESNGQI